MKIGIIRCMQTEDYCPGTADFKAVREKTGVFADVEEEIVVIGFINCGGCPGKKAVLRARELVKRGRIHLRLLPASRRERLLGIPALLQKE